MNYLGLNVYGEANVEITKCFHDRIEDSKHLGYLINQTISDMLYKKNEEGFLTCIVDHEGHQYKNLSYTYTPYCSIGFGCIILKNNSFNERYKVEFRDKEIGKYI